LRTDESWPGDVIAFRSTRSTVLAFRVRAATLTARLFTITILGVCGCAHGASSGALPSPGGDALSQAEIAALRPGSRIAVRVTPLTAGTGDIVRGEYHGQTDDTMLVIDGNDRTDIPKRAVLDVHHSGRLLPRVEIVSTGGIADFRRSTRQPNAEGGVLLGGAIRVHPAGPHGIFATFVGGAAVFGPSVIAGDAGYSLRLFGSRFVEGVTGALHVEIGPALGSVSGLGTTDHATFGGRAGITADVHLWNLLLGIEGVYRGGVPLGGTSDVWESALSTSLRAGVLFDVPIHR
jgi:hypothetical protein